MDGHMMMAMNIHREICGAVMGGGVSLETEQIIRCSKIAVVKVEEITQLIKDALEEDEQERMIGKVGVFESAKNHITTMITESTEMDLTDALQNASEQSKKACRSLGEQNSNWHSELKVPGPGTAQIGHGGENTWSSLQEDLIIIESDEEKAAVSKSPMFETKTQVVSDEDSEEEDVVILTSEKVSTKSPTLETPLVTDPNTVKNPNEKQTAISSATKKNKKRKKKRT
ncbi:exosome complex component RRP45-like isoform X2 [Actinia tenebrosa]|uniref:Exosome complex component RRP45-like isoform X2 n=1 Tax=Actinia tenebrosa TaxID=6105 RepID=A0A6P8J9J2_ACTTE|nr:exosome complex component RRP45-like isoform X2 [Actinia tenebrosa]